MGRYRSPGRDLSQSCTTCHRFASKRAAGSNLHSRDPAARCPQLHNPCRFSKCLHTLTSHARGRASNLCAKHHRTFLTESANSLHRLSAFAEMGLAEGGPEWRLTTAESGHG